MQAVLDMFAFLNSAIDGGVMTQKAFSIAVLGLSCRIHSGWREGEIPGERLSQFTHELQRLDGHWKAHCKAGRRPRLVDEVGVHEAGAREAGRWLRPIEITVTPSIMITPAMKRAGVAAIERGRGLDAEELAIRVYRAMATAA